MKIYVNKKPDGGFNIIEVNTADDFKNLSEKPHTAAFAAVNADGEVENFKADALIVPVSNYDKELEEWVTKETLDNFFPDLKGYIVYPDSDSGSEFCDFLFYFPFAEECTEPEVFSMLREKTFNLLCNASAGTDDVISFNGIVEIEELNGSRCIDNIIFEQMEHEDVDLKTHKNTTDGIIHAIAVTTAIKNGIGGLGRSFFKKYISQEEIPTGHIDLDAVWEDAISEIKPTEKVPDTGAVSESKLREHFLAVIKKENPACKDFYYDMKNHISALFAKCVKDIARYVNGRGWFIYTGKKWEPDEGGKIMYDLARIFIDSLVIYKNNISNQKTRERFEKITNSFDSSKSRKDLIEDVKTYESCILAKDAFDKDQFLNVKNGTINLENMSFHRHTPKDFLTKMADVDYDPTVKSVELNKFLNDIMLNRAPLKRFLCECLGYTIGTRTSADKSFWLYGKTTRNGKGTLMELTLKTLGDYATTLDQKTLFLKTTASAGHSDDIAQLDGRHLAVVHEFNNDAVIDVNLLKTLSGSDEISCREIYKATKRIKSTAKIVVCCNRLPVFSDETIVESDRAIVIPFDNHFEDGVNKDQTLRERLCSDEAVKSAMLNWLLQGYVMSEIEQFEKRPTEVMTATACLKSSRSDSEIIIDTFLKNCLVADENAEIKRSALYDFFTAWSKATRPEMAVPSKIVFGRRCVENGLTFKSARPKEGGNPIVLLKGFKAAV